MLCWKPAHFLSRNYTTGLCCQVWTGSSPACSPEIPRDLPLFMRTVGAQCQPHRHGDDVLTTSHWLMVPETSSWKSIAERLHFLHAPICLLVFFFLWQVSGRVGGWKPSIHRQRTPAKVSLGFNILRLITKTQWVYGLSYRLHTEWTSVQAFP